MRRPEDAAMLSRMRLRLFIVDDSALFLESARTHLEREGITVVGVATTSAEALELIEKLQPDVTLVDIDLGEENGFDLVERLAADDAGRTKVILVSTHSGDHLAELIASSPASGFLSKTRLSAEAIFDTIARSEDD
jgi:DNA-binding NarL/FixJ family response regulator